MTKLSNIINRQRMLVGGELGNDTADLLEEQAREIEKLKVALAKRVLTADEQRKDFDGLLKNWSKQGYEIKELRAALVDCQRMLHYVKPRVDVDTQNAINLAITRSKEV